MAKCKMWVNMESKGVESKMENNFKLVLNDKTEIKYFNNLYSIKEYLKNNKWENARVYEHNGNEYELIYFL